MLSRIQTQISWEQVYFLKKFCRGKNLLMPKIFYFEFRESIEKAVANHFFGIKWAQNRYHSSVWVLSHLPNVFPL